METKVKKIVLGICVLFSAILFIGCLTVSVSYGSIYGNCYEPEIGYEGFAWGTDYDTIKGKIPIGGSEESAERTLGKRGSSSSYVINDTILHFTKAGQLFYDVNAGKAYYIHDNMRLYAAEDKFLRTPSMEQLHSRYGNFSEKNVVTPELKVQGVQALYKGEDYLDGKNACALKILIYKNGQTVVRMQEPFYGLCKEEKKKGKGGWFCYSSMDTQFSSIDWTYSHKINFTFLNYNDDGNILFIGYSKGLESSGTSSVRAGICWREKNYEEQTEKEQNGRYEIKGRTGLISKEYKTGKWNCFYDGTEYLYTSNANESSREFVEMFTSSERVLVRHNDRVSEFDCNGEGLLGKMAEYGITWEELDEALMNEEF